MQAAALPETYFTVWSNLFDPSRIGARQRLLVHGGSSGIGLTAIQLARDAGAKVYATVGSEEKAKACLKAGAHRAINYRNEDFTAVVAAETEGQGVDAVLDMVGAGYVGRNLSILAVGGVLVQVGLLEGGRVEFDLTPIISRRLTITGSSLRVRTIDQKAAIAESLRKNVWPVLESGSCLPVIGAVFPLESAAEAHRLMESSQHIGKIMLLVRERDQGVLI